jgi:ubiquinone/menaquinone biosynthesis C-methylase UbiE
MEGNYMDAIEYVDFDNVAGTFEIDICDNLGLFSKYRESMIQYKSEYLKYFLPIIPNTILEFGCGIGTNIRFLKQYFPTSQIYGCDISSESIRFASEKYTDCHFSVIQNVEDLQIYADKIDCIFISCVLHHIPFNRHAEWINALYSILHENSYIAIFEMNPYNLLASRAFSGCVFDRDAHMLKPSYCKKLIEDKFSIRAKTRLHYTYFFPWRNKYFVKIEHGLLWLPLGAQYCVVANKI